MTQPIGLSDRDADLYIRAQRVIGGVPATYSKAAERYALGVTPYALESGTGPYVYDVEGNKFIDTVCGLGPVILGHGHTGVTEAVMHSVVHGASMSLLTELEVQVAEQLCDLIPSAEMVRFSTSGSDVTNAAVRIARAATKNDCIIACGYHGTHDWYVSSTERDGGVLGFNEDYICRIAWDDTTALEKAVSLYAHELAAIIVEVPPLGETDDPMAPFLTQIEAIARNSGEHTLFVLDEVVTGLRYHPKGAQHLYGVTPDLTCLSKGLGNGFPIAALCGRRELLMECITGTVMMSSTFAGNTVGLAAAQATMKALVADNEWDALYEHGTRLCQDLRKLIHEMDMPADVLGNHARLVVKWLGCEAATAAELKTLWIAEMAKHGVLTNGVAVFPMTAYTEAIVNAIMQAAGESCLVIRDVVEGRKAFQEVCSAPIANDVFAVRP